MRLESVTHVTASVSTFGGGIPEALSALVSSQLDSGLEVSAIGHKDSGNEISQWPNSRLSALPTRRLPWMTWAPTMTNTLKERSPSIIHTHGLWTQASLSVPRFTAKHNVPYLVSPHGMLDEWALNCSKIKKKLAAKAFENRHLENASCLHALCRPEERSFRNYGISGPIAVIPNGIDLPDIPDNISSAPQRNVLLFLGRIHPKKGLANAIQAFTRINKLDDWLFVIAGWDQGEHLLELQQLCEDQQINAGTLPLDDFIANTPDSIDADIIFVGPAFGEEKDILLRQVDAFILPSYSEGMPMSVLEAWSYQLPVIMTEHCNIPEGFDACAAWKTGTEVEELRSSLTEFFRTTAKERTDMGQAGRTLVENRFTWSKIASDMIDVYRWVLGEHSRPDCVTSI